MFVIDNDNIFGKEEDDFEIIDSILEEELISIQNSYNNLLDIYKNKGLDSQLNSIGLISNKLTQDIGCYKEDSSNDDALFIVLTNLAMLGVIVDSIIVGDEKIADIIEKIRENYIEMELKDITEHKLKKVPAGENTVKHYNEDSINDDKLKYNVNRVKYLFED